MNYLIIGSGWVGQKLLKELINRKHNITICSHKHYNTYINQIKYDFVINCAGYIGYPNVDACEKNKLETLKGNAIFPIALYERCKELKLKLAHFSSGCIYEGKINDIYDEPNFFGSTYSISKGISDSYLKSRCLLFRVRLPFDNTDHPKNLLTKLKSYANNGKLIEGGKNSITNIDEAVSIASNLIESEQFGPFNLVNKGSVTTKEIIELMNINAEWYKKEEFEKITLAKRSNCTIPEYEKMSNTIISLKKCIEQK